MRKTSFIALLFSAFIGLAVTASSAFAGPLAPGCSQDIMDIQKHHSDAMRARDKAYSRQIFKENDSTLGMTCFDQQLGITSDLGSIFSDVLPTGAPAASAVFTSPLAYANQGVTNVLADDLLNVVNNPGLVNTLNDFVDSLSFTSLGTGLSNFISWLTTWITNFLTQWLQALLGLGSAPSMPAPAIDCNRIQNLWNNPDGTSVIPIEGNGIEKGIAYTNLQDLLTGAPPGITGSDFLSELSNDNSVLSAAMTDLTTLSAPGNIPSWPTAPTFPVGSTTASIISGM